MHLLLIVILYICDWFLLILWHLFGHVQLLARFSFQPYSSYLKHIPSLINASSCESVAAERRNTSTHIPCTII